MSRVEGRARWSKGCSLCVKRRVKCDEKRPGCGNCTRYGAECPGYTRKVFFVQARPHRRTKESLSRASSASTGSPWTASISSSPDSSQVFKNQALASASDIISSDYKLIWGWFSQLSSRLGESSLLDIAIECFSLEMIGRNLGSAHVLSRSRAHYVRALSALQRALYHATMWRSSETLCTSALLCLFELYAGTTSSDAYVRHVKGIESLIEARGLVRDCWTSFDIAVVQTFRSVLIIASVFGSGHCSLTEDRWRLFFRENPPAFIPGDLHVFYEDYYDLLSQMPDITHRAYDLLQTVTSGSPFRTEDVPQLLLDTIPVHEGWVSWNQRLLTLLPAPREIPSPRGDPLYPLVYLYDDPWRGSSHIIVASCMLITNLVFSITEYGGDRSKEVRHLVDRICKSVETVSKGTCGPSRVAVGLRISYEAGGAETREWIKGWLREFEGRYAATNYQSYPKTTAVELLPS